MNSTPSDIPSKTPPLWPSANIAHARGQLLNEFPFADPAKIISAIDEAAEQLPASEGSVLLMRRARDILRQAL